MFAKIFRTVFYAVMIIFTIAFVYGYIKADIQLTKERVEFEQSFSEQFSQWTQISEEALEAAYVKGKLAVIHHASDSDGLYFDTVYWSLPDALRADLPEEAETVVRVRYTDVVHMVYGNQGTVYQNKCVYDIIDLSKHAIIAKGEVLGPEPPVDDPSQDGEKAYFEVQEFLEGLPRR
jgi:hypothetical protein